MSYNPDTSLLFLLHRASQVADESFTKTDSSSLTSRQFVVLAAIARSEGVSQTGIVGATGIDRSTMADIIQRMHRQGLVTRKRTKEDARTYAVKLTAMGRSALSKAEVNVANSERQLFDAIAPKARGALIESLQQLVDTSVEPVSGKAVSGKAVSGKAGPGQAGPGKAGPGPKQPRPIKRRG
jgi:DNA-binding MarR family transcriptional regulator